MHWIELVVLFFVSTSEKELRPLSHSISCNERKLLPKKIKCGPRSTIYIKKHVMEEACDSYPIDLQKECTESSGEYCSASFPQDPKAYHQNQQLATKCNQKHKCSIKDNIDYIEEDVKTYICDGRDYDYENITFRHSIKYECIPEFKIKDICRTVNRERVTLLYFNTTKTRKHCQCALVGNITSITVLESDRVDFFIETSFTEISKGTRREWFYNESVPITNWHENVTIHTYSIIGRFLAKVTGSFTYQCGEKEKKISKKKPTPSFDAYITAIPFSTVEEFGEGKSITEKEAFESSNIRRYTNTVPRTSTHKSAKIDLKESETHWSLWIPSLLFTAACAFALIVLLIKRTEDNSKQRTTVKFSDGEDRFMIEVRAIMTDGKTKRTFYIHKADCVCEQAIGNDLSYDRIQRDDSRDHSTNIHVSHLSSTINTSHYSDISVNTQSENTNRDDYLTPVHSPTR